MVMSMLIFDRPYRLTANENSALDVLLRNAAIGEHSSSNHANKRVLRGIASTLKYFQRRICSFYLTFSVQLQIVTNSTFKMHS